MTTEGNIDKAKAELVRVWSLAYGVSEQKIRANTNVVSLIESLINLIDDEAAFCELVNKLTGGKSDKELKAQAIQIVGVAMLAGPEAAKRRLKAIEEDDPDNGEQT